MWKFMVTIFVLICYDGNIVEANECFASDSSAMTAEEFTRERNHTEKFDHHVVIHDKIRKSPHGNNAQIQKFLDIIGDEANSKYFKDRMQSIIRTVWLASVTFGDFNTQQLCIFSDFLTSAVMEENGVNNDQDWTCTFQELHYSIKSFYNEFVKWILYEQGCPKTEMIKLELPTCFNSSACAKEGRKYLFDEIWIEYDSCETELEQAGEDSNDAQILLAIAKELHSSQDFYENYVAAMISASGVVTDWLWKANTMHSHSVKDCTKKLGLLLEAASTVKKCDCTKLESRLRYLLESFLKSVIEIFANFKANTKKMGSHGHIPRLSDRKKKSSFRNLL